MELELFKSWENLMTSLGLNTYETIQNQEETTSCDEIADENIKPVIEKSNFRREVEDYGTITPSEINLTYTANIFYSPHLSCSKNSDFPGIPTISNSSPPSPSIFDHQEENKKRKLIIENNSEFILKTHQANKKRKKETKQNKKTNQTKGSESNLDKKRRKWWQNVRSIFETNLLANSKKLYTFDNPENCAWKEDQKGQYFFELDLLDLLGKEEGWNFKRYCDNHSKNKGSGQTFIFSSSKQKELWDKLRLKSSSGFKKARLINVKAFTDKHKGFLYDSKYKQHLQLIQTNFTPSQL